MSNNADLLKEYGWAIRRNWGDIDGRSEKMGLDDLAESIEEVGNGQLSDYRTWQLRMMLSICQHGEGHWEHECRDYGCAYVPMPEREPQP